MVNFGWNYPPGVTGNEFAISGPDYEHEVKGECGNGHPALMEYGYQGSHWWACGECNWQEDLHAVPDYPDYDEMVEVTP